MATAKVFRSGNSQAVRLPKAFRVRSKEVEIFRRGDEVELRPSNASLEPLRLHPSRVVIQGVFRSLMRPSA